MCEHSSSLYTKRRELEDVEEPREGRLEEALGVGRREQVEGAGGGSKWKKGL